MVSILSPRKNPARCCDFPATPNKYYSIMLFLSRTNVFAVLLAIVVSAALPSQAFLTKPTTSPPCCCPHRRSQQLHNYNDATGGGGGGIEEIEFRIYPDGRVTEIVRGVKGKNCQSVTEAINKQLGNVVASSPTEEMFEEEVLVKTTLEQKDGWDGASSW